MPGTAPPPADDEKGRHKEDDQFDRKKPEDDTQPMRDGGEGAGENEAA